MGASGVVRARKLAMKFNLDEEQVGQQFLLFSSSSMCCSWKTEYALHLEELKEKKEKAKHWVCLPSLLNIFKGNDLHTLYAELYKVICIVAAFPVSVASCERAHSKVKIIHSYLRPAMMPERLENLILISSERDIADKIELEKLVKLFKLADHRKLAL